MDRKRWKLNRQLLGFFLLAGLLVMSVWGSACLCRRNESVSQKLELAADCARRGDWDGARSAAGSARQLWDDGWDLSLILEDHAPMEQIDADLSSLAVWAEREEPEFAAEALKLSRQVMALADAHRISWRNLL